MRRIDTSLLSTDECWSVQINGFSFCQSCKWIGISACVGQNIHKTGRNSKGYKVGWNGIMADEHVEEMND